MTFGWKVVNLAVACVYAGAHKLFFKRRLEQKNKEKKKKENVSEEKKVGSY